MIHNIQIKPHANGQGCSYTPPGSSIPVVQNLTIKQAFKMLQSERKSNQSKPTQNK